MSAYIPIILTLLVLAFSNFIVEGHTDDHGKKWAVLVAGSSHYRNYRHQADICHAYQVLKKGGLKDENIVVFMYDDIAFNKENPRKGVIINKPGGPNVYQGVPKDYTGDDVNIANFFGVILGNKSAITGGSGKVVNSGPNDSIFIFYVDHGGPGFIEMPNETLYAKDLIHTLKKKHSAKGYNRMLIYVEACEAGTMFDGLLPQNLNIFVTTASNSIESSFAVYCPGDNPGPGRGYDVCLGDMYSVSWIEDSEINNLRNETLWQQYQTVRRRTRHENTASDPQAYSHVMQYGTKTLSNNSVFSFIGTNPKNDDFSAFGHSENIMIQSSSTASRSAHRQRDTDLVHFYHKMKQAPEGSDKKIEAQKQLDDEISSRFNVDQNMNQIAELLFGSKTSLAALQSTVRSQGQALVDDWDCFKLLVKIYEEKCGRLSTYGKKYMRAIANMCNAKITGAQMASASAQVCGK